MNSLQDYERTDLYIGVNTVLIRLRANKLHCIEYKRLILMQCFSGMQNKFPDIHLWPVMD